MYILQKKQRHHEENYQKLNGIHEVFSEVNKEKVEKSRPSQIHHKSAEPRKISGQTV